MKICIYGAGGPVAAGAIRWLEADHELLLTDVIELDTPHAQRLVDVTDADQVAAAAEGMDVLINCTVQRTDPMIAFDVNLRGAYNVVSAAVRARVPRLVHTGPAQILSPHGYWRDFRVTEEAPDRAGVGLYALSKYLGHEVVRTFCRHHPELSVVVFYYCGFFSDEPAPGGWNPNFAVHVDDAGQAFKQGAEIARDQLPSNFEVFHISADMPDQHVSIDKARRILGYEPQHNFPHLWSKRARAEWPEGQA